MLSLHVAVVAMAAVAAVEEFSDAAVEKLVVVVRGFSSALSLMGPASEETAVALETGGDLTRRSERRQMRAILKTKIARLGINRTENTV